MRIRDLKKKSGNAVFSIWPPSWGSSHPGGAAQSPLGEQGILESVERHQDGLLVTMRWKDKIYGPERLVWDQPPTVAEVQRVLRAHLGEPIQRVSDLEV